jgi:hypothetical protein
VRRNRFDVISLVAGLFFLGVAAVWGLSGRSLVSGGSWLLPLLLVAVGVIGLIAAIVASRLQR